MVFIMTRGHQKRILQITDFLQCLSVALKEYGFFEEGEEVFGAGQVLVRYADYVIQNMFLLAPIESLVLSSSSNGLRLCVYERTKRLQKACKAFGRF